ncbi:MAG: FTR1 family iron permease [Sedimenticola sp.]|nr:FTR1 family iron permease [Sedimenticola sp.]
MARLLAILLSLLVATVHAAEQPAVPDFTTVVSELSRQGEALLADYEPTRGLDAADGFSGLYFDLFEGSGMELAVGMEDPALKSELEALFSRVIGLASRERSQVEVAQAWQALRDRLEQVAATQQPADTGFWGLLVQALLILLREGFEAILVVTALIAYLRRQGAERQLGVVYQGVGWALLASLLTAWALNSLFQLSSANQEGLEGVTMLVAAGVLFYVSYWLISKCEAARWQAFIEGRIDRALSRGSLFALGAAAFLAVYREGAETVLFYQALNGQANGQWQPLALGFVLATAILLLIYKLMQAASFRLPIGLFFSVTALLLYYLAISFAGGGVLELQEAGWIGITPLQNVPSITWLGLYPSLESVSAQVLLLLPLPLALLWWWRSRRQLQMEYGE